ncbi:MAG: hypothetical protein HY814_14325 [Candidatus Riflebacteria bacterium]|nr:hypothetical protein [Candidatus Riflebacteria bacterium]
MTDQINCETPPNGTGEDDRHMVTLGLGVVLGAKFLYPWTCPNPSPDGSYPARYRLLCPSVQIFVP